MSEEVVWEQYAWEVGIHPLVKVFSAQEKICDGVGGSRYVFKCIIEVLKELNPTRLSSCDLLWFAEVLEVFVVCADFDWVFCTKEKWPSTFESKDNAGKFFVVGVIILFS